VSEHEERTLTLIDVAQNYFNQHQHQLNLLQNRLRRLQPDRQIAREQQTLDWKRRQLIQLTLQALQQQTQKCDYLRQKLATLDPHNVLKRGYALVRSENGEIIRSVSSLKSEQELSIELGEGKVKVKILETFYQQESSLGT
jgi:exodeoxyribonuclease VII large subunit